jgi:hypothetical protein
MDKVQKPSINECCTPSSEPYRVYYATSRMVAVSIPDEVVTFFNWSNPSNRIMAFGSTKPLTEISTRNLPRDKGWPTRKIDNLTIIYEPIV